MTSHSTGKPTLVHLNNSASQRVLWLLEELDIEYNLEAHKRVKSRAPPELQKTHPLGKSPQLLLADGRVLIESSNILKYLIETYDNDNKFKGDGQKNDAIRDQELSDLVSSSINGMADVGVIFLALIHNTPFVVRPLMSGIWKALRGAFFDAQIDKQLQYLDEQLDGQDFLMGSSPGRPDFLLSFVYDNFEQRRMIKEPEKYSRLRAWSQRCKKRPAWQRSLDKGNGYDLSGFDF